MNNLEEKRSAMVSMIEDWQSSGKSKKQYCLEKGINEAKFYYWYARINEKESLPGKFIPIEKSSGARDGDLLLLAQLIRLY